MKNKNLVGLLALASCVVLGGCDLASMFKKEPVVAPEVTLTVSDELPTELVVGQEYDLSEYVTLTGATSWEVVVAEESLALVTVDGTKVTATEEGEIKLTVKSGDKEEEVTFTTINGNRKVFRDSLKGNKNNYAFFELDDNGGIGSLVVHNDNYFWTPYWSSSAVGGGFLMQEDSNYVFRYSLVDDSDAKITVNKRRLSPKYMEYYNPAFPWTAEEMEIANLGTEEEPIEALRFLRQDSDDDSAQVFYEDGLGGLWGDVATQSFPYLPVGWTFVPNTLTLSSGEGDETTEINVWSAYMNGMYLKSSSRPVRLVNLGAIMVFGEDIETLGLVPEQVDAYIESGEEPVSDSHAELDQAMKALVAAQNYTMTATYGWYDDESVDANKLGDDAPTMLGNNLPTGKEVLKVTSAGTNQTVEGNPAAENGVLIKDGHTYTYSYSEGALVGEDQGEDIPLFNNGTNQLYLYTGEFLKLDSMYSPMYVYEREEADGTTNLVWDADTSINLFKNLFNMTAEGFVLASIFSLYTEQTGEYLESYVTMTASVSNEAIVIKTALLWDDGQYYVGQFEFTNIGSTVLPEITLA